MHQCVWVFVAYVSSSLCQFEKTKAPEFRRYLFLLFFPGWWIEVNEKFPLLVVSYRASAFHLRRRSRSRNFPKPWHRLLPKDLSGKDYHGHCIENKPTKLTKRAEGGTEACKSYPRTKRSLKEITKHCSRPSLCHMRKSALNKSKKLVCLWGVELYKNSFSSLPSKVEYKRAILSGQKMKRGEEG